MMDRSLRWTPGAVIVPAPTLADAAPLLFLWARFTGRIEDTAPATARAATEGPSGRYMAEHL